LRNSRQVFINLGSIVKGHPRTYKLTLKNCISDPKNPQTPRGPMLYRPVLDESGFREVTI